MRWNPEMSLDRSRIILKRDKDSPVPVCKMTLPSPGESETPASQRDQHLARWRLLLYTRIYRRSNQNLKTVAIDYSNFESSPSPGPVGLRDRDLFRFAVYIVEWNEVFMRKISRSFSAVPSFVSVLFLEFLRRAAHTRGTQRKMNRETTSLLVGPGGLRVLVLVYVAFTRLVFRPFAIYMYVSACVRSCLREKPAKETQRQGWNRRRYRPTW